ncbi:MAG: hypothetical protein C0495_08480 [Acinetobacter sp.]|jgi:ElaB/YqjD/DUF883 family membrane-anchored ribosome-binding protein|nr:hypothetical protein [Acinetobacter sp.]
MYDPNKEVKKAAVKDNVANIVDNTRNTAAEVASEAQASAARIGNTLQERATETRSEVINVINSLKALIAQYADFDRATDLKNQLVGKATEIRGVVQDEVTHAYQVGKERTVQTVQEKPLTSVAVALGAGVLLGYILGSKQTSHSTNY